ncbi:MAG: DUF1501 domain-containing protein [Planctomycetes bacterium]|nr:DUF1501 domain-containing protein [Planctomycetota bacterium]
MILHELPDWMLTRRCLLRTGGLGLGAAALATLLDPARAIATSAAMDGIGTATGNGPSPPAPHFPAQAKSIIYLFMHGGPSQIDLFDYKPQLKDWHGQELPPSVRGNQRLTGMTANQDSKPLVASAFRFAPHGQCGALISELLPHLATVADELCILRGMHTEAINHDPAVTYMQTGHQQPGRPSMGAWLSYGLGTENQNLPAFVVLLSRGSAARPADPLYARLWGAEFLPSQHQGTQFRSDGEPVLFLSNPPGLGATSRRRTLDSLAALNRLRHDVTGDPEIEARIAQYEKAFRMQTAVPELTDLSNEPESLLRMYGPEAGKPGSFATNCLLARRLVERGVRFVQLYHRGWDQHYDLPSDLRLQCGDVDQPCAALIRDLKSRGLLDQTLLVWGGEFGRTVYCQGKLTADNYGRDHHGRCFSMWLAGGGIRPGLTHGETDDHSFNVASGGVHIHDLNATILHSLGLDHTRLTFRFQGRDYRLTDVYGRVVEELLG